MSKEGKEYAPGARDDNEANVDSDGDDNGANVDRGDEADDGMILDQPNTDVEGETETDEIGDNNSNKSPLSTNPYSPKPDESNQESDELVQYAEVTANLMAISGTTPQSPISSFSTSTPPPLTQQVDVEDVTVESHTMGLVDSQDPKTVDKLNAAGVAASNLKTMAANLDSKGK